jgi:helicase
MFIESLALDDRIKKVFIQIDGIKELYPPQTDAIKRGLLEGKNLVIAIPTAAGKTLLAELAALKHVIEMKGKVIYLCPLRALASEKFSAFKRFSQLGIRVAITSGDYDSNDSYLSRFDIIVSTNEKMDALLRHRVSWIAEQVTLVIIDECHLLDDQHRGPTLETLLARLMIENTSSQLIALSATVGNADELAEWLNAELVQSEWRPVPLKEGVYFDDHVTYSDFSSREIPFRRKDQLLNITLDSIHAQEQILIFTPSRRSAVATAERIGKIVESSIKPREAKHLNETSSQAVINLSDPLSKKLAETIKRGVTFHHAGLNSQQRELVETAFKKGFIKALCATPTLAAGVNVPAKRVVVSSVYRYSIEEGSHPIKTLEYKQMSGRAGRPQFDTEGESIILAKQERVLHWLMDRYILRDSEPVYSKLAAKPALRRNILGLIASHVVRTVPDLLNFFEKTFYGFQFEAALLEGKIREVIDQFIIWEMIKPLDANETLATTQYGLRVSQLYLDPETAASLSEGLTEAVKKTQTKLHSVALLDLIVGTPDMIELSFRKKDEKKTEERLNRFKSKLIKAVPDSFDIEYEFRLHDFKTVLFLWDWINELPIEQIIMRYNIGSGDIKRVVDTATWIMSALAEISTLKTRENRDYKIFMKRAQSLSERVRYGIKKDAISLTQIKGIGRKRARVLLDHGIRDVSKLLTLNVSKLSKIPGFGTELSKSILRIAKEFEGPKKEEEADFSESDMTDYFV